MSVDLSKMREWPGLLPLQYAFVETKEIYAANVLASPIVPKVSLPAAIVMGIAAAIMRNPIVSRRWW